MLKKFSLFTVVALSFLFSAGSVSAEEKKKIEDMVEKPTGAATTDLSTMKRHRLTEEQAAAQLQYMMINGMQRVNDQLVEKGSFKPIGMTLDPDGTFRTIRVDGQDEMPQEVAVEAIVGALKGLASARTQWAVGIMYVTGTMLEDGSIFKRIVVVTEHIAGWARVYNYPYKMIDGQLKMGKPVIQVTEPVYYQ